MKKPTRDMIEKTILAELYDSFYCGGITKDNIPDVAYRIASKISGLEAKKIIKITKKQKIY